MYADAPASEIVGGFELHVTAARNAHDAGDYAISRHLVEGSLPILDELVRRMKRANDAHLAAPPSHHLELNLPASAGWSREEYEKSVLRRARLALDEP